MSIFNSIGRQRRFHCFNNLADVRQHISEVKTIDDLNQLRYDITASGTNLTRFKAGCPGIYAIDFADSPPFRHVFMTRAALDLYGEPTADEADSWSVLEDSI